MVYCITNKSKKIKLQFPWDFSELIDMALCTWTYYVLSLCKVSSKSIKRFRRSCAGNTGQTDWQASSFHFICRCGVIQMLRCQISMTRLRGVYQ